MVAWHAGNRDVRVERDVTHAMHRISWLIHRINTLALRHFFMVSKNMLRMRDGLVSLRTGNLRRSWGAVIPVLAFKGVSYAMSLAMRLGLRPTPPPAPVRLATAE